MRAIQRADFIISFYELLLGITGIVTICTVKDSLDTLQFIVVLLCCILFTGKELLDIFRIFKSQQLQDAIEHYKNGVASQKDIFILTSKGYIREEDNNDD